MTKQIINLLSLGALFLSMLPISLHAQKESDYINQLTAHFGGISEYKVENGRVDILTDEYAIEVERAEKWKHSIGQSLWYALQTNKKPGIILIIEDISDRKHGIRLQSAIDYAGLGDKIRVWFYPEDFPGLSTPAPAMNQRVSKTTNPNLQYSRNKNSGVRHNSTCGHFDCKNCVPCGPTDGKKACGTCGG